MNAPSLEELVKDWAPGPVAADDSMTVGPAAALAAVIGADVRFADGDHIPPAWHWLYFLSWPPHGELGEDGHPSAGSFMPPIPNRRRMIAGGRIEMLKPLMFGLPAHRDSRLLRVSIKRGSTGDLVFVTVRHEIRQDDTLRLVEDHETVYRRAAPVKPAGTVRPSGSADTSPEPWRARLTPDPCMLFRFSALTANAHRIHYDESYTRSVEGFPGLVVHGPLLVIHMLELARRNVPEKAVSAVAYRMRSPVFCGEEVLASGSPGDEGTAHLRIATDRDAQHATAEISLR